MLKPYVADWRDAEGRRHRKRFADERAARDHEHKMVAAAHLTRLSLELGRKIADSTIGDRRRPQARRGQIRKLVEHVAKIATIAALGKKPPVSLLTMPMQGERRIAV